VDQPPPPISPQSPEARRKGLGGQIHQRLSDLGVPQRFFEVLKRVVIGTFTDGFILCG
jgi:membrane protein